MRCLRSLLFFQLSLLLLITVSSQAGPAYQDGGQDISFTISMSKPQTHLLEVEIRIDRGLAESRAEETLVMPVWTPGSYLIREFERHVQDFAAFDDSGRRLEWEKINKNSWRVRTRGARHWRVTYRVYANELTVRTSELNSDHAFWNNAALLMYLNGQLKARSTLQVIPPAGWKVATGLPPIQGKPNSFRAENFDILYDSPFEVSNFKEIDFSVRGVAHRIVIDGEGNYDPDRIRSGVEKIVETEAAMFGEIPDHDYTFILHLRANTGGGLEHLNSTALGFRRSGFATEEGYRNFWGLVAHEFFHLWNVKRIRPDALGPFDYTKENYTRMLWVAEGVTEYYANLMVRRAGLMSEKEYLDHLARQIQSFENTPGRLEMSAEEASFDAWIKYYRPDENSVNSSISYYDKGELLGLLLDLEIRRRTHNRKSLDDVMRYLYEEFYKRGRNYSPADFQKTCELVAGSNLELFFTRYVRGRAELDYEAAFIAAGLRLDRTGPIDVSRPASQRAWLGAELNQQDERLIVSRVLAGSPAYDQGLNANDQIVALDGTRVNKEMFETMLTARRPGDVVRLTIFRFDDLRTLEIRLGVHMDVLFRILTLPQPTDEQRQIYQAWMGEPALK